MLLWLGEVILRSSIDRSTLFIDMSEILLYANYVENENTGNWFELQGYFVWREAELHIRGGIEHNSKIIFRICQ